jgi:hypothetical protein
MMLDVNRLRALARGEIPAAPAKTPFSPVAPVAPVAPPAPVAATGAATGLSPCSYSVTGATGQKISYYDNERNEPIAAPVAEPVAACSASAEASEYEIDEAEREAIAIELGSVPTVYASGFARLQAQPPPEVPCNRWDQFINDAGLFFDRRGGKQAEALGWRADELFGLDPVAPMARYDRMGLIWMLKGERVVGLTATTARLSGGLTVYRKR